MKKTLRLTLAIALTFSIFGCSFFTSLPFSATVTPTASNTPQPTATFTPTPTPQPTFTPTFTVEPTQAMDNSISVTDGGYTIQPPKNYVVTMMEAMFGVINEDETIWITFFSAPCQEYGATTDDIIRGMLESIFEDGNGKYEMGSSHAVTIGGVDGTGYEITGTYEDWTVRGQAVAVVVDRSKFLFGLGMADTDIHRKLWEDEGSQVFSAMIDSISFIGLTDSESSGTCEITTDNSYGYTQDNPIKVGGGALDGPSRERAYLDNLLSGSGKNVIYKRVGSENYGETILDNYQVSTDGKRVTLYIDEYSYSEPLAPVGFTCVSAFPLSEPEK